MRKQLPIVAVVLLLWNAACTSDESGVAQVQSQNKITRTDLDHEPVARELISKLQNNSATGRVSTIEVTDAFFKYEDLDSGILNYTFKLPDDSPDYFENLVLSKYDDGFYGFIYRYIPDDIYTNDSEFKGILQQYNLEGILIRELTIPLTTDSLYTGGRTQLINQCVRSVEQTCVTTYEVETVTDYPCHCQYDRRTQVSKVCTFSFNMGWCDDMIAVPPAGGGGTYIGPSSATPRAGGSTNAPKPVKNPVVVVPKNDDIIYDKVKSPCLKMVIKKLVNKEMTNDINKAILDIFEAKTDINLYIDEDVNLGNTPGRTKATREFNSLNVTISLNPNLTNSASEYITSVLYHEAMHAYLNVNTTMIDDLEHHVEIAENYTGWLKDALIEIYPKISNRDANALALRGLGDVMRGNPSYWNDLIKKLGFNNNNELISISDAYRNGTSGTTCF